MLSTYLRAVVCVAVCIGGGPATIALDVSFSPLVLDIFHLVNLSATFLKMDTICFSASLCRLSEFIGIIGCGFWID